MSDNTRKFRMEIDDCCIQYPSGGSIPNFLRFLREKQNVYTDWINYYTALRDSDTSITDSMIAEAMGISDSTVGRFKKSIPSKRDYVIMLAAIFGKSVSDASLMLKRYAHYADFYPKSLEDNVWMYILSQGRCLTPCATWEKLLSEMQSVLEKNRKDAENAPRKKTVIMASHLKNSLITKQTFTAFVRDNGVEYGYAYMHLRRIILNKIKKADNGKIKEKSERAFANSYFKNDAFIERHYHEMKKMKNGYPPTRDYIILLGLHLGYMVDDINELLKKANYNELCVKDSQEACIYFALSDIDIKAPAYSGAVLSTVGADREMAQAMKMEQEIICESIKKKGLVGVVKDYLLIIRNDERLPEHIRKDIKENFIKLM